MAVEGVRAPPRLLGGGNEAGRSRRETGLPDPRGRRELQLLLRSLPDRSLGPLRRTAGEKTRFLVEREGETIALESKVNFPLRKGDRLIIEIAGGGGYGDPRKRAREDVERDLREGLITEEEAREVFGLEREAMT